MLVARDNDAYAQCSAIVFEWLCERGSVDPDLDMLGPKTLPLSHNALQIRAPRNSS